MKKNKDWDTLLNSIFKEQNKKKAIKHAMQDIYHTWFAREKVSNTPLHRRQDRK